MFKQIQSAEAYRIGESSGTRRVERIGMLDEAIRLIVIESVSNMPPELSPLSVLRDRGGVRDSVVRSLGRSLAQHGDVWSKLSKL